MLSFEKCIYHQLYKSFDVLLVSRQSALRKHHGCDTALKVKFNLDSKRFVGVVSLDLRKTFDSLPLDLLLAKLAAYGLSSKSTGLMVSLNADNVLTPLTVFLTGQQSLVSATRVHPRPSSFQHFS